MLNRLLLAKRHPQWKNRRRAFTLVEMLVVVAIMLILTAVTVASFNYSVAGDRMRAGARQLQSILVGARDKAIYAKEIRGVRLLLDSNDNHSVSAVQYIGAPQRQTGSLTFNANTTGDPTGQTVSLSGAQWSSLFRRGFLRVGTRIQIPADTGTWYTVSAIGMTGGAFNGLLTLNRPNHDLASTNSNQTFVPFVLEFAPGVLGDAQPVPFPRGVVIDLDGSQVPSSWVPSTIAGSYSPQMDILFTPRGTVVGDATTLGMMHLHFADTSDVTKWNDTTTGISGRGTGVYTVPTLPILPADNPSSAIPVVAKDHILLTISVRTGNVSVHPVNPANSTNTSRADDPYFFAETGQVAGK